MVRLWLPIVLVQLAPLSLGLAEGAREVRSMVFCLKVLLMVDMARQFVRVSGEFINFL